MQFTSFSTVFKSYQDDRALKEIISQTDEYLVSLSSKTYVFEDKITKY